MCRAWMKTVPRSQRCWMARCEAPDCGGKSRTRSANCDPLKPASAGERVPHGEADDAGHHAAGRIIRLLAALRPLGNGGPFLVLPSVVH